MRFRSRGISWLKKAHTHLLHITRAKKTLGPELWALCSLPGTQCADSLVYYNYSNNTVYLFFSKFNKYYSSCHVCFNFHFHTKSQTEPLISVLNAFTEKPKQINKEDKHLLLLCLLHCVFSYQPGGLFSCKSVLFLVYHSSLLTITSFY